MGKEIFELTDVQMAYLLGRNENLHLGGVSTHFYVEFDTKLNIKRLSKSLNKVITRQPMLRAIILDEGKQMILDDVPEYNIAQIDLSKISKEDQEKAILNIRKEFSHRKFPIGKWPMFSFKALKIEENLNRLIVDFDMMIIDGLSTEILIRDIMEFYENQDKEVEILENKFKEYIETKNENKKLNYENDRAYWLEQLEKFPLGPDLPIKEVKKGGNLFAKKEVEISAKDWQDIKNKIKSSRVLPAVFLLTTFAKTLSIWSNQDKLAINMTTSSRKGVGKDVYSLIGDFTELLPVDIDFTKGEDLLAIAKEVQKTISSHKKHGAFSGIEFMKEMSKKHSNENKVVFPVVFTSMLYDKAKDGWDKVGERVFQLSQTPQVMLDHQLTEKNGSLTLRWDYIEACFDDKTIEDMFNTYISGVLSIIKNNKFEVKNNVDFLNAYNNTEKDIDRTTLQSLFNKQVSKTPNNVAIKCGNESITYKELDEKSSQVANSIVDLIGTNRGVGVEASRNIETIVNILGILKSGGYYIPISVDCPESRRKFILENSNSALFMKKDWYLNKGINYSKELKFNDKSNPKDIAYVIYTSGSTGAPKGVVIDHVAVCNTILDINEKFNVSEYDNIIGISSICFDLSVYDVFGALSSGGTLVIIKDPKDVLELKHVVQSNKITIWNTVPAIIDLFISNLEDGYINESIKTILLSGDWIPVDLPKRISKKIVNAEIVSLGGATEGSIWSIYYPIKKVDDKWTSIPYGYPLANQKMYVLNYEQKQCPIGVPGEIYIGGVGVAREYQNDIEKSKYHFIEHDTLGKIYRTGDYGKFVDEGYIEFLGRKDNQIKIRGYRVELGEIENILKKSSDIKEVVTKVVENSNGGKQLVTYITPAERKEMTSIEEENKLVIEAIKSQSNIIPEEVNVDEYKKITNILENMSLGIMIKAFMGLGIFVSDNEVLNVEYLFKEKIVVNKYKKLIFQWLDSLVKFKYIQKKEKGIYCCKTRLKEININGLLNEAKMHKTMKYWKGSLEFLVSCNNHIADILSGKVDALSILFPDGQWSRAENFYRYNPVAEYNNRLVAVAIEEYVKCFDKNKTIKILEFGAGTGGTTVEILKRIKNRNIRYTYTDLSTFFTDQAKELFSEYSFIDYGLFNIDEYPQIQGYDPSSYDIIIGANVLHDAKILDNTIENLRTLLSNNGLLVILELTTNKLFHKVSIGLIEGFSSYSDSRLEKNEPLLSPEEWEIQMRKKGMDMTSYFPSRENAATAFEQHVILGYANKNVRYLNEKELNEKLLESLPEYMIPNKIYYLDKLPLSANGKVDINALPYKLVEKFKNEINELPNTETEKILCEIASEVLKIQEIGINRNLIELGVDSLKCISIVSKAKAKNLEVSLVELYQYGTIKELASHLDFKKVRLNERLLEGLEPLNSEDYKSYKVFDQAESKRYPLNNIQMAYLIGRNEKFELGNISTHYYAEIESKIDILRFEESINKVISHQPMLRTIIYKTGEQEVLESVPRYLIDVIDISMLSEKEKEEKILFYRDSMSHTMIDTEKWPLFQFKALKLSEEKYYLHLGIDVMIADGASFYIFGREILHYYNNPNDKLSNFDFRFRDYLKSLENFKSSPIYERDKKYWTGKLEDFPKAVQLPLKKNLKEVKKPQFKRLSTLLNKEMLNKLKKVGKKQGLTPSAILCYVYSKILSYFSNESRFAMNLTLFNRYPFFENINNFIGDFTSTIILDIDLQSEKDFWKQAKVVQNILIEGVEHRSYDGIDFLKDLAKQNKLNVEAIMPVIFTCALFEEDQKGWEELGEFKWALSQTPQVYLDNQIMIINGELSIVWDYVEEVFHKNTIEEMFKVYTNLINQICNEEEISVESNLIKDILNSYNNTNTTVKSEFLDGIFKRQVLETPGKTAVILNDREISYKELDLRSNEVANYLLEKGVNKQGVAIIAEKSISTIIGILGILKAGAYYVPIDPNTPDERRDYIINNSKCCLLLTSKVINNEILNKYSNEDLNIFRSTDDIAYVIYTSGSTGNPKGVIINHLGACNTILDINSRFDVSSKDNIIGISSNCFDLSVYDMFGALSTGASLVLIEDTKNISEIKLALAKNKITFWNSVPAIIEIVIDSLDENYINRSMKNILLSGDWIPINLVGKIREKFVNAQITSLGGATEASIWSVFYPIKDVSNEWKSIPYGYPLINQSCYILNYEGEISPIGVKGELYIGGVGLALGYINNEEETNRSFINHPKFGRLYKTGDFAVMHKDGYINLLGRSDNQVKISGFRVELGEIEHAINNNPLVKEVAVTVNESKEKSKILTAYMVSNRREILSSSENLTEKVYECANNGAINLPKEISPEKYYDLSNKLEKISTINMISIIEALIQGRVEDEKINIHDFIKKYSIRNHYTKLIRQWFNVLVKDGLAIKESTDNYIIKFNLEKESIDSLKEEIFNSHESKYFEESLNYMGLCNENAMKILQGEETVLNLLFPEGNLKRAQNLYHFNPVANYYNEIVSSAVEGYIKSNNSNEVKILEVGAGTGGTTVNVLRRISNYNVKYKFTDLSTFFTDAAKELFNKYNFIDYDLYNIDLTPQEQGYVQEENDIIIASNVMHDAKNINNTINNLKSLLKPNGILIILEAVENTRLQMVTSAFIDGFSYYEDFRLEKNEPMLSAVEWENEFKKCGFQEVVHVPKKEDVAGTYGQSVIIGKKDSFKYYLNTEELSKVKYDIRKVLPEYMTPKLWVQMEKLPLSKNGKVDRKNLPNFYMDTQERMNIVLPRNELEQTIYNVWKEVLKIEEFGVTDDFFEIGGDSLKAIKIISKLNSSYDVDVQRFFECSTIEEIACDLQSENKLLDD